MLNVHEFSWKFHSLKNLCFSYSEVWVNLSKLKYRLSIFELIKRNPRGSIALTDTNWNYWIKLIQNYRLSKIDYHWYTFFEIYKIDILSHRSKLKTQLGESSRNFPVVIQHQAPSPHRRICRSSHTRSGGKRSAPSSWEDRLCLWMARTSEPWLNT